MAALGLEAVFAKTEPMTCKTPLLTDDDEMQSAAVAATNKAHCAKKLTRDIRPQDLGLDAPRHDVCGAVHDGKRESLSSGRDGGRVGGDGGGVDDGAVDHVIAEDGGDRASVEGANDRGDVGKGSIVGS